jgi:hypothetical protein
VDQVAQEHEELRAVIGGHLRQPCQGILGAFDRQELAAAPLHPPKAEV